MAYCSKCGREVPFDAVYCPNCGAQTRTLGRTVTENEFDRLTQDRAVQEHWFERVIAYIIDAVIYSIAFAIIMVLVFISTGFPSLLFGTSTNFAFVPFSFNPISLVPLSWLWGILFVLYFTLAESWYGRTIGKSLMHMHVVTIEGRPADFAKTFVRNFSKINWLLLLIDVAVGLFTHTQPGQKYSDHLAGTIVSKEPSV